MSQRTKYFKRTLTIQSRGASVSTYMILHIPRESENSRASGESKQHRVHLSTVTHWNNIQERYKTLSYTQVYISHKSFKAKTLPVDTHTTHTLILPTGNGMGEYISAFDTCSSVSDNTSTRKKTRIRGDRRMVGVPYVGQERKIAANGRAAVFVVL